MNNSKEHGFQTDGEHVSTKTTLSFMTASDSGAPDSRIAAAISATSA